RRVAVVYVRVNLHVQLGRQLLELGQLVLGQRFGRKQIERPRRRIAQNLVEHGQVVAHGLARGGGRNDDGGAAGQRGLHRLRLVDVQVMNAAALEGLYQPPIEARRETAVARRPRRQHFPTGYVFHKRRIIAEGFQQLRQIHTFLPAHNDEPGGELRRRPARHSATGENATLSAQARSTWPRILRPKDDTSRRSSR